MRTLLTAAVLVGLASAGANAAPGDPDRTFGTDGEVAVPIEALVDIAVDGAGRIVVAGIPVAGPDESQPTVIRVTPTGTLDPSFGVGGIARPALDRPVNNFWALGVQPDGRPLLAVGTDVVENGTLRNAVVVVRLTTAGALDPSFGVSGSAVTTTDVPINFAALLVDGDGGFVVARTVCEVTAECTLFVDRFTADGMPIDGFASGDAFAKSVALQPDGRLVTAGRGFEDETFRFPLVLTRYLTGGRRDHSFGKSEGRLLTDVALSRLFPPSLALARDGKLVVAGSSGGDMVIARFLADGRPDRDFGSEGSTTAQPGNSETVALSVAVLPDGRIVAAGATGTFQIAPDWLIAAFLPDGTLDTSFGDDGLVVRTPTSRADVASKIRVQPNGRLIVAGFTANGPVFGGNGPVVVARYLGFPRVCADADGDGAITVTDAVQVLRAAADLASSCLPEFCDLDASGAVTVSDGVQTLRTAAELPANRHCPD